MKNFALTWYLCSLFWLLQGQKLLLEETFAGRNFCWKKLLLEETFTVSQFFWNFPRNFSKRINRENLFRYFLRIKRQKKIPLLVEIDQKLKNKKEFSSLNWYFETIGFKFNTLLVQTFAGRKFRVFELFSHFRKPKLMYLS